MDLKPGMIKGSDSRRSQRVALTGVAGFVGRHLAQALVREGFLVLGVDRRVISGTEVESLLATEVLCDDLSGARRLGTWLRANHVQAIVHAAAFGVQVGQVDWKRNWRANVSAGLNVVEAAAQAGLGRVIHLGTSQEYGTREGVLREDGPLDPQTPYGATKAAAFYSCRERAKELGLPWVELRPFLSFGPGERRDKFFPSLILPLLRGEVPTMTGGEQVRDVVYIKDLVRGILGALKADLPDGIAINLGSGEGRTLRTLAEVLLGLFPGGRIDIGARPYRDPEVWHQVADVSRAKALLGWSPTTPLPDALGETVDWYRNAGRTG